MTKTNLIGALLLATSLSTTLYAAQAYAVTAACAQAQANLAQAQQAETTARNKVMADEENINNLQSQINDCANSNSKCDPTTLAGWQHQLETEQGGLLCDNALLTAATEAVTKAQTAVDQACMETPNGTSGSSSSQMSAPITPIMPAMPGGR